MDTLVEMAKAFNEGLVANIVLNRVSTNPVVREDKDTREFILQEKFENLGLTHSMVYDRIAFRKAARDGISAMEYRRDKKAMNEMNGLYEEIYGD